MINAPITQQNIVLIGMAGAGKSTIGRILAKALNYHFLDTDLAIEQEHNVPLQALLDREGYLGLRALEEHVLLKINCKNTVIATGGSAIYSELAMHHLRSQAVIVFLDATLNTIKNRIGDYSQRGLAKPENQSLDALFEERLILYRRYADYCINTDTTPAEQVAADLCTQVKR